MTARKGMRRTESNLASGIIIADETSEPRNKSAPSRGLAQLSVDSDDENPDPEILAQFLERKTDFSVAPDKQRLSLWQEKTKSLKRVHAILFNNGDLLNPEAAQEDAESIREDIQSYFSLHDDVSVNQSEELFAVGQWFNHKTDEAKKSEVNIDLDDLALDASFKDVGHLVSTMGALRGKMSSAAEKLLTRMIQIVKNDDSKRLLKEQQERFATEINTIMEALQRVEGHAKGLTTSNLELRENLKQVEAEKLSWQRRYMSLQAKEESIVRQMEIAIQQRTEALQIHLRKGDTGALQQLMDQVRQHQVDLFAAQEQLRTKEEELSKNLAEKQMLEERIANFAFEMRDLRQAAGPTANLIQKLRSDVQEAQMNERKMREELRLIQAEMRAKPKAQTEVIMVSAPAEPAVARPQSESEPRPATPSRIEMAKIAAAEEVLSLQKDISQLHSVIKNYKSQINEKDEKIKTQTEEILSRDELIKVYVDTTSSQFDKIQAKSLELTQALEARDRLALRLKTETQNMSSQLRALKEQEGWEELPELSAMSEQALQSSELDEMERNFDQLTFQNKYVLEGFHLLLTLYQEKKQSCSNLQQQLQKLTAQTQAANAVEKKPDTASLEKHTSAITLELCKHFCNRAYQYYCEIARDVFDAEQLPISNAEASSLLNQAKDQFSGKKIFDKILDSLVQFVKDKWSTVADLVASIRQNAAVASELSEEKANINFHQLLKASQLADIKKAVTTGSAPAKALKTMQERYEEQKRKWEEKKAKIKAEQATCIMKCLHSFMQVVQVNFKGLLGSHVAQQTSAFIYSSLLDDDSAIAPNSHASPAKLTTEGKHDEYVTPKVVPKVFTMPVRYVGGQVGYVDAMKPEASPPTHRRDRASFSFLSSGSLSARESTTKNYVISDSPTIRQLKTPRPPRPTTLDVATPRMGIGVLGTPFGAFSSPYDNMDSDGKGRVKYHSRGSDGRPWTKNGLSPALNSAVSNQTVNVTGLLPSLPFL